MIVCSKCIYNEQISGIKFDKYNICNYCKQIAQLKKDYGTGTEVGKQKIKEIFFEIKKIGRNKKYDCIIGVSGGTDSSYLLMKAIDWGLRPLAVHYDNTWNSAIATQNVAKITKALNVDLYTHVVNNVEIDDIKKAFLLSGVAEFDTDTDLAFVQVLRTAAAKFNVKYILEGHSFIEEGISPIGTNYFDGAYIADIHKKFGTMKMNTYPNMTFFSFLKWIIVYRQKFIRPLWYMPYSKDEARDELKKRTDWKYYGGHHLENRGSAFAHSVWIPERYGIDYRILVLAAKVRSKKMKRNVAIKEFLKSPQKDKELVQYVKKRLSLSDKEYSDIMSGKKRTWVEFKTYKKRFENLKFLFFLFSKFNLVPKSFYLKYCFPVRRS
jgi:tRNA(Ile)-lysidine synthase TilS/MesJ